MAKTLVIVESPTKSKTIEKFLGKNYTVKASMGHLRDLPKSTLGVTCLLYTSRYSWWRSGNNIKSCAWFIPSLSPVQLLYSSSLAISSKPNRISTIAVLMHNVTACNPWRLRVFLFFFLIPKRYSKVKRVKTLHHTHFEKHFLFQNSHLFSNHL